MAKFRGKVGYYTGKQVESSPGVYQEEIVERVYSGDISRVSRRLVGEGINGDVAINHQISVVADAFAVDHFFNIRYVEWSGVKWFVQTVEVNRPRLILYIGTEFENAK